MSFDSLAPHYRWMERILAGDKLQRARIAHLHGISKAENILILGEGPGRFLIPCRRAFPNATITVLDASAKMLDEAKLHLGRENPSTASTAFVETDALQWIAPHEAYDLIATHFFLDCFPPADLARLIASLAAAAKPGAHWLISDFAIPSGGFARARAQAIHRLMYVFFRTVTKLPARHLTAPDPFLRENNFELGARQTFDWGLVQSDLWTKRGD